MVLQVSLTVDTLAGANVFNHMDLRFDALSVSCVVPRNDVLRGSGPVETSVPIVPIGVFRNGKGRPFDNGGIYLSPQRRFLSFDGFPEVRRRDMQPLGDWLHASMFELEDELCFAADPRFDQNLKHLWKRLQLMNPQFGALRSTIADRRLKLEKRFLRRKGIQYGSPAFQDSLDLFKLTFEKMHGIYAEKLVDDEEVPAVLWFGNKIKSATSAA